MLKLILFFTGNDMFIRLLFFYFLFINTVLAADAVYIDKIPSLKGAADISDILINGYPLKCSQSENNNTCQALSLNTKGYNTIESGGQIQKFKLSKISSDHILPFTVNHQSYNLLTYPEDLPVPEITDKGSQNGLIATSFFVSHNGLKQAKQPTSYAVLMTNKGDIVFYHASIIEGYSIGDFRRHILKNGDIRYTFMQRTKPLPPYAYWYGKLIVLDENFQKINELTQIDDQPDKRLIENHDALLIEDDHYILPRYQHQLKDKNNYHEIVAVLNLQEIKDQKVIFEWKSSHYPELYDETLKECDYASGYVQDYVHFNSVVIDPKDGNLILSFRHTSTIYKIDRKTGDIIWRLGGKKDDYNLTPEQKFLFQHTASITSDGYLMLFDNQSTDMDQKCAGNFQYKKYQTSRILKFKLDEKNKKVVDFQQIQLPYLSQFMGNVFETNSGTYIVGYGSYLGMAGEEFDKDGNSLWTLKYPDTIQTYHVIKYD